MASASGVALDSVRVVRTVKKPSCANFWATAPPTPHSTPTGRWLSSNVLPCASKVLRPSDCHLEVAPTTTATCLPLVLLICFSFSDGGGVSGRAVPAPPGAQRVAHDEAFVLVVEPRQFLGEHCHTLVPGAGHFRNIGTPEHAVWTEGIVNLAKICLHRRERVGLSGIAGRTGCFDGDVGELRQCQQVRH